MMYDGFAFYPFSAFSSVDKDQKVNKSFHNELPLLHEPDT